MDPKQMTTLPEPQAGEARGTANGNARPAKKLGITDFLAGSRPLGMTMEKALSARLKWCPSRFREMQCFFAACEVVPSQKRRRMEIFPQPAKSCPSQKRRRIGVFPQPAKSCRPSQKRRRMGVFPQPAKSRPSQRRPQWEFVAQRLRPVAANAAIFSRRIDSRGRLSLRDFRMQSGEQPSLCGLLLDRPGRSLRGPSLRLARLPRTPLLGVDQPSNPYAYKI